MPLTTGTRLGPYEITALVGVGGMGEVYKAFDTRLERTVAIKVLPPRLTQDGQAQQRLAREARVVAGLSHPHICPLFDIGQYDGTDFLVMEYWKARRWPPAWRGAGCRWIRRSATPSRWRRLLPRRMQPVSSTAISSQPM